MITDELRQKLVEKMRENPKEVIRVLEEEPKLLEALLNSAQEANREKNEKIRYVNMTIDMQRQLQEKAKELNTTQGILMGAGLLLLLSLLDRK